MAGNYILLSLHKAKPEIGKRHCLRSITLQFSLKGKCELAHHWNTYIILSAEDIKIEKKKQY